MTGFLDEVRETLAPSQGSKDGPLPPMLVGLTVVSGLVDAFCFLMLGHVFVANMTGNVVFVAFALGGVKGFSIESSLIAVVAFVLGGLASGKVVTHHGKNRGRLLYISTAIQTPLFGVAAILAFIAGANISDTYVYALVLVLGISMGLQNGIARKLAVPDLTTTVLTMTLTGLGADSSWVGRTGSRAGRRLVAIGSMVLGAFVGAVLILNSAAVYPLIIALGILAVVAIASLRLSRNNPAWSKTDQP
jgi:uncharacterized membrane protein YoaK (UPF0700 family)